MTTNPTPTPRPFYRPKIDPSVSIIRHRDPVFPPADDLSFGCDALRREPDPATYRTSPSATWREVSAEWGQRIDAEQLVDVAVAYYRSRERWHLRPTDGALVRGNGQPLAWQPRAWASALSLLAQEIPNKPRGPASPIGFLSPEVRTLAFGDFVERSRRGEGELKHSILLRTHLATLRNAAGALMVDENGAPLRFRTLRAVLSGRHSGIHFDDSALRDVLEERVDHDAPAYVSRGTDETHGVVTLDREGDARATLHFRNSETGAASLTFGAACYLSVLDATVRRGGEGLQVGTDLDVDERDLRREHTEQERRALVASAHGAHRRRHSLPTGAESMRAEVARGRIAASFDAASADARALVGQWRDALRRFPAGLAHTFHPAAREEAAAVVLDAVEEQASRKVTAADREALRRVLVDEARLEKLPFLSAAHIAGAFACIARDTADFDEARRLQALAGEWVERGWK